MPYWIFHFFSLHFDQFRFISFRFFRYISLRFVWFRFVSISFRTLQVPYYMANNLSNSYSNDMLTVKLSGFPDMHWRDLFTSTSSPRFLCRPTAFFSTCWSRWTSESSTYGKQRICLQGGKLHIIILYSSTFYKKGHVIRRNLKIPNARVSRFVDWCAVMTLESFSCMLCQSKEFDRVTDWLKHSLQAIVVYVKYLFMFQNDPANAYPEILITLPLPYHLNMS
jgi:hypothetical protein